MHTTGDIDTSCYDELLRLAGEVKRNLFPKKEKLIELWGEEIEKIGAVKDLHCVINSFDNFISYITHPAESKNALELYWNNLWSIFKDKLQKALHKTINNLTTFDEIESFLSSVTTLVKNGIGKNILDKEKVISQIVKVLENELNNVSTVEQLFKVKNNFSDLSDKFVRNLNDGSYNLLNIVENSVKLTTNIKMKAFRKLVALLHGKLDLYTTAGTIETFFGWISVLDYRIYIITEIFNSVKCIVNSISLRKFLEFVLSSLVFSDEAINFLECFIEGKKGIGKCNEKYGIIETILGMEVTIENLSGLKDKLDSLKGYMKFKDIPAIEACCEGKCKDVGQEVKDFCKVINLPDFKECCNSNIPLHCCNANSTTFCLDCIQSITEINCIWYMGGLAYFLNDKCREIGSKIIRVLNTRYTKDGATRTLLCDMIEKYGDFCQNPKSFIENKTDEANENRKVVELECECTKCEYIKGDITQVCNGKVNIDYKDRTVIEGYLEEVKLLEEARNAIRNGFPNIGVCPLSK